MIAIYQTITPAGLLPAIYRLFKASGQKLARMEKEWDVSNAPVEPRRARAGSTGAGARSETR